MVGCPRGRAHPGGGGLQGHFISLKEGKRQVDGGG